jgi:hypothetical protein
MFHPEDQSQIGLPHGGVGDFSGGKRLPLTVIVHVFPYKLTFADFQSLHVLIGFLRGWFTPLWHI